MIAKILSASAVLIAFATPVEAQSQADSPADNAPIMQAFSDASQKPPPPVTEFVPGQVEGEFVATDLIGRAVYTLSGLEIGRIVDVGADSNHQVTLVVVDVGELLGNDKQVAFAFDALAYQASDEDVRLVADIAPDGLEKATQFTSLATAAALNDMQGSANPTEPTQLDRSPSSNQ